MKNILDYKNLLTDDLLSHYTTINTAVEDILFSGFLRFSSFLKTNDPFEYQSVTSSYGGTFDFSLSSKENDQIKISTKETIQSFADSVPHFKIACFCRNENEKITRVHGYDGFGFTKPRMWAQYGDSHKGCCILFSKNKLLENISSRKIIYYNDNVEYHNSKILNEIYPHGSYDQSRNLKKQDSDYFNKKFINNYIFSKHIDFKNENEYRIVLVADSREYEYISIENCIIGIVISDKTSEFHKKFLNDFSIKSNIPLIRIKWNFRLINFDIL